MKSCKNIIKEGGVAVIRTDTLYGLVADAHNQHAVARIYDIKKRNPLKPVVVLAADYEQIASFVVNIPPELRKHLESYWPGKVSILLPASDISINTHYIHKGTGYIAFRIPDDLSLRKLLLETGPLVAPSANPEGQEPARTIQMAIDYFGDNVDYYLNGGRVTNTQPSKIIKINADFSEEIIRN